MQLKRLFFSIIVLLLGFSLKGAPLVQLSENAKISVLTFSPGQEVSTVYGHTAIRINDVTKNLDIVFNYGVFGFYETNFILRFARGQTDYMLDFDRYFQATYDRYKRNNQGIYEQVLNLTEKEKNQIWEFLNENLKVENREYRYNFFYDNCATRVRDAVISHINGEVVFPTKSREMSFMKHASVYQRVLPWLDFGTWLALGSPANKKATSWEEMFLPEYLKKHFDNAEITTEDGQRRKLVESSGVILAPATKPLFTLISPLVASIILMLFVVNSTIRQQRYHKLRYFWDNLLLLITGTVGVVACLLMLFSEHPAVQENWNILWALPTNLIFFFIWKNKYWRNVSKWYWPLLAITMSLFLALNFMIPQSFYPAVFLIVIMVLIRAASNSWLLIFKKN